MLQIQGANKLRRANEKSVKVTGENMENYGLNVPVEIITPEQAEIHFERRHPKQRALNNNQVRNYLDAMRAGEWIEPPYTFNGIAFDVDGLLVDGQTRMKALSMHDKPLKFIVIRGVRSRNSSEFVYGDRGGARPAHVVHNTSPHVEGVCNALACYMLNQGSVAEFVTERVRHELQDALSVFPSYRKPKGISALVRSAFVLYWKYMATPSQRLEAQSQYEALARLDYERMTPAVQAYVRRDSQQPFTSDKGSSRDEHFRYIIGMLRNPNLDNPKPKRGVGVAYDPDALTYPRQYMAHLIADVRR